MNGYYKDFVDKLNTHHPTLRYMYTCSESKVDFLDATVYKGPRFREKRILDIKPYFKSTNKFQYTHFHSSHPPSTFRGLVKGEAIRLLRLSSDPTTYKKACKFLARKFREPYKLVRHALNQVPYHSRPMQHNIYLEKIDYDRHTTNNRSRIPFCLPLSTTN